MSSADSVTVAKASKRMKLACPKTGQP